MKKKYYIKCPQGAKQKSVDSDNSKEKGTKNLISFIGNKEDAMNNYLKDYSNDKIEQEMRIKPRQIKMNSSQLLSEKKRRAKLKSNLMKVSHLNVIEKQNGQHRKLQDFFIMPFKNKQICNEILQQKFSISTNKFIAQKIRMKSCNKQKQYSHYKKVMNELNFKAHRKQMSVTKFRRTVNNRQKMFSQNNDHNNLIFIEMNVPIILSPSKTINAYKKRTNQETIFNSKR